MNVVMTRSRVRMLVALGAAACALALVPCPARALFLLDEQLSLDGPERPVLTVALADDKKGTSEPSLDFDLLGTPAPVAQVDDRALHRRRTMLTWHQGLGLGLLATHLGTTVVGQLNYSDKYGSSSPRTARYEATHGVLAFTTLGLFVVNGTVALLAPSAKGKPKQGFDRVSLHKLGMALATAGMLAQGATGIYANSREGYLNQEKWAKTHLAIGYATFAAVGVAVGALVF